MSARSNKPITESILLKLSTLNNQIQSSTVLTGGQLGRRKENQYLMNKDFLIWNNESFGDTQ